jgi:hypothetical protein
MTSNIILEYDLVIYFGKRSSPYGWKVKACDLLSVEDCLAILTMYEIVYVHPPSNGDYSSIFLKGWSVENKGHIITYLYAFDSNKKQMKRTICVFKRH